MELVERSPDQTISQYVDPSTARGFIIMMPDCKGQDGVPLFHDDAVGVIKTLQAGGLPVVGPSVSQPTRYLSEYSAAPQIVSSIVLGVAGNFTYDIIKVIVTLAKLRIQNALHGAGSDDANVQLEIDEIDIRPDGAVSVRGFSYIGPVGGIETSLGALVRGHEEVVRDSQRCN